MKPLLSFTILLSILTLWPSSDHLVKAQSAAEEINTALELAKDSITNYDEIRTAFNDIYNEFDGLDLSSLLKSIVDGEVSNTTCITCKNLLGFIKLFKDQESLIGLVMPICDTSTSIDHELCHGLLERLGPHIFYIIKNTILEVEEGCAIIFSSKCLKYLNFKPTEKIQWELPLPAKREFKPKASNDGPKKVLHLTDVHLDLYYSPQSEVKCARPLCCRATPFIKDDNITFHSGLYGDLRGDCDVPVQFVSNAIEHIAEAHPELDYIFWTGDNVPHNVWDTSEETNLDHVLAVTKFVKAAFADNKKLVIVPALGNHEIHPINLYVPEEVEKKTNFTSKWLYNRLANHDEYWSKYLDSDEIKATFNRGGYYSKMLNDQWKVIVLNSNFGYKSNFWVALDPRDPGGQLQWLIDELDAAEKAGVYATILGHIPPNGDAYDAWIRNYIRITDRYSHLIRGAFNGHTHKEELVILYNETDHPVGVNYVSASLTTFSYLNPAYKVLTVDGTGQVLDYAMHYLNMDNSNAKNQLQWAPLFTSAKEVYGLEDLSPESWNKWYQRTLNNQTLIDLYYNNYHRKSAEYPVYSHDDNEKIKKIFKGIRRTLKPEHD